MQTERWKKIDEVFQSALDCEPAARAALLNSSCAGDPELRQEVESLLASYKAGGLTNSPAPGEGATILERCTSPLMAGHKLGPYRIVREIGRGGMGVVYLAARADEAFEKLVAVKVLSRGLEGEDMVKRFRSDQWVTTDRVDRKRVAAPSVGSESGSPLRRLFAELGSIPRWAAILALRSRARCGRYLHTFPPTGRED